MSPSKPENTKIKSEEVDEDSVHPDDADDLIVKDIVDGSDEGIDDGIDEVGEIDQGQFVKDIGKIENNRPHDGSNVDNEDSLNLTIGEDEEKIFQEEESEVKEVIKGDLSTKKSDKKETSGSDQSPNEKKTSVTVQKVDENVESKSGSTTTNNNNNNNNSGGSSSGSGGDKNKLENDVSNKKDDSDHKPATTKSSSKDEKESTSKSTASSTSKAPASRNLWVSGLSSLTRATDLKIIFSKYGKVIGAKVVTNTRTPGTRCYGYVTMGSSSDASKCIEHLHRTELHGRIISVEKAKSDIGIAKASKPESKTEDAQKPDDKKDERKRGGGTDKDDTSKSVDGAKKDSSSKLTDDRQTVAAGATDDGKKRDVDKKRDNNAVSSSSSSSHHRQRIPLERGSKDRVSNVVRKPPPHVQRRNDRDREVLSFQKIREERERQRLRERERKVREEERRRQESRRRQRDEEERLLRERERLKKERVRLERERADLLRLERERQKLEREKIELERLELKRQQLKIEEAKRAIKRPATDHERDRYTEVERKRTTTDRRFEPPPPPRFDTSISRSAAYERSSEKKRIDDYPAKRDDYKRETFKRPAPEYSKRELESPRHSGSNSFDVRNVPIHRNEPVSSGGGGGGGGGGVGVGGGGGRSSKDRYTVSSSDNRGPPGNFSSRGVRDDRDSRTMNGKSRYMDDASNNDSRYADRSQSSSWPNTGPPPVKPFHMQSVAANDPWGQKQTDNNWRSMEPNQDRYDRTYNERKSQSGPSQYIDQPRQNSFITRPQDRYSNNMSSRFDNGRF